MEKATLQRKIEKLSKIFDLSKIPEDELRKQYYDVSLVHFFSGLGSPLLKVDGKYLTENDSRIYPADEVKTEIDLKYDLSPWQIRVEECEHDIQIMMCVAKFTLGVDNIISDMRQMGYSLSVLWNNVDYLKQVWVNIQFEPLNNRETI